MRSDQRQAGNFLERWPPSAFSPGVHAATSWAAQEQQRHKVKNLPGELKASPVTLDLEVWGGREALNGGKS